MDGQWCAPYLAAECKMQSLAREEKFREELLWHFKSTPECEGLKIVTTSNAAQFLRERRSENLWLLHIQAGSIVAKKEGAMAAGNGPFRYGLEGDAPLMIQYACDLSRNNGVLTVW